jgi:hypothetical protein
MRRPIEMNLTAAQEAELKARIVSLGISKTQYVRTLVLNSLRREKDNDLQELKRMSRAIIIAMAEGFGRTQKADKEMTKLLAARLLETFDAAAK